MFFCRKNLPCHRLCQCFVIKLLSHFLTNGLESLSANKLFPLDYFSAHKSLFGSIVLGQGDGKINFELGSTYWSKVDIKLVLVLCTVSLSAWTTGTLLNDLLINKQFVCRVL